MSIRILHGDCLIELPKLAAAGERFHAVVTDPPYGLEFMGKEWDAPWKYGMHACETPEFDETDHRLSDMRKFQAWCEAWARAVYDVLLPGGFLLAFGGTRTSHRLVCAIEDAGFEIRDTLCWLYGTGFPKSLNIGDGMGTALKPAFEPIILARKPLIGTVAANVLQHGTGAINIDACRVAVNWDTDPSKRGLGYGYTRKGDKTDAAFMNSEARTTYDTTKGRWPANVLHDGSPEVLAAFAAFGESKSVVRVSEDKDEPGVTFTLGRTGITPRGVAAAGTAARFFKACEYTDSELLLCRAKAILAAWNPDLVSTADDCTCLSSEAVASALNDAAILASQGTQRSCPVASTNATPTELRRICETAIAVILSSAGKSSFGLPRENAFPNGCHARCVDQTRPTGITTITISHWKSDGSAAPVTFSITQANSAPGEAASEASRFHYSAKADKADRADSKHPTVKPVDLIRWLVTLACPPGGHVLDCFAGSGTTGEACMLAGFDCTLIEREAQHARDIEHRIKRWSGLDAPLFAEIAP